MLKRLAVLLVFFLLYLVSLISPLKTESHDSMPTGFAKSTIATGLNFPDAVEEAPDGRVFILEKTGAARIYKNGTLLAAPFLTLPVDPDREHGLLGIAFDPNFSSNHFIYLGYVNLNPKEFRVSRFIANGDTADPSSETILFRSPQTLNSYHIAGTVRFGPDGKLWISIGDNAIGTNAQDLSNIYGKILRINRDGTIPSDNPFYGLNNDNGAIWAYGFRNPYRFSFLADGRPIVGDVGEATTEEVNIVVKGGNYGWPRCEGSCASGYINPLFSYVHNGESAAVVGGFMYKGNGFGSAFQNTYFYADYSKYFLRFLKFDNNGNFLSDNEFDDHAGLIVDLTQGQDGSIYYVTFSDDTYGPRTGQLHKITYNATNVPPNAVVSANPTAGLAPLVVNFSSQGSVDPNGANLTYSWDFGDGSASSSEANPSHTYTQNETYTATLTVNNGNVTGQATKEITVGRELPIPTIITPSVGANYNAGDTISFSGDATDAQDGNLSASVFTWSVLFHHQTHVHPFIDTITGVKSGTFTIPDTGESSADTSYEIVLTVKNSAGLTQTVSRTINPNVVNLSFNTLPISGLAFTLDGIPHTAPYTIRSVVGFKYSLDAPPFQTLNGFNYTFSAWSDGQPQAHFIATPQIDSGYTAGFHEAPAGTGHLHFRVREIDSNGNVTNRFINGATAKLTDPTGMVQYQTTTSKTVNGEDGWVFFDNVPSGDYGVLSYKQGGVGMWRQTTCEGAGTAQNATIKNNNTENFVAAWQNTIKVVAGQMTWCTDEGLRVVETGTLAMRVALIEDDPSSPTGHHLAEIHLNDVVVKLTDTTGNTVIQTTTSKKSGDEDGWVQFQNIPAGTYGLLAYKPGFVGFWKMTDCVGGNQINSTIQNANTEGNVAAWNSEVPIIAGVVNYCHDLGLRGFGSVHFRVREFNNSNVWTGRFVSDAVAKLTDPTGATVYKTTTSQTINGEDGWVFFDDVQAGYYASIVYKAGAAGIWKQADCGGAGTTVGAQIQNDNTENQVGAWNKGLHLPASQILWCSDLGLATEDPAPEMGSVHFRVREVNEGGVWTDNFINGATAKLTDAVGATVVQVTESKTINGEDGWVFFDFVPVGNYGILTYKQGLTGIWKQTDCNTGDGTTVGAQIQNDNTENQVGAWRDDVGVAFSSITWCKDEGLRQPQFVQSMIVEPTAAPTPQPEAPTPTLTLTPTPTEAPNPSESQDSPPATPSGQVGQ